MKTILLSFSMLILCAFAWAQSSLPLRGTITLDGEVAMGARILLVGTEQGTYTDQDGNFFLSSPLQEGKLSISLFGALSQIIEFTPENNTFEIKLTEQAIDLEKVEIIGYRETIRIHDPVCGPCRSCHSLMATPLRQISSYMSDPVILNGQQPQLSISRQGDAIRPSFAQAPLGMQATLSFNSMPLDQKTANLFLFLWESNPSQLVSFSPNE
ncbi:MAG: carboxypeptidase-like regulatory domain-containing protein, partial [Bacteroidota bacterium]